jgi:hypothetical protein
MAMGFDLVGIVIQIIVGIILVAPVLWLVGRALVGGQKAKFTDAIWIVALGIILGAVIGALLGGLLGGLASLIVWLGLIKHFFDCGWLKALLIAIVAVVVFFIIAFVLAVLGILALGAMFGGLF